MNTKRYSAFCLIEILVIIAIIGILAALAIPCHAQPVPPNPPDPTTFAAVQPPGQPVVTTNASGGTTTTTHSVGGDLKTLGGDLFGWLKDNKPFFTNSVIVEAGALYAPQLKHGLGAFVDFQFPVDQQLSLGFAVAYLNGQLYDASLSARLGTTFQVPLIKRDLYAYVESGPGYNISKREIMSQSFAGGIMKFTLGSKWTLTIGGALGNISDVAGPVYAGGASLGFSW